MDLGALISSAEHEKTSDCLAVRIILEKLVSPRNRSPLSVLLPTFQRTVRKTLKSMLPFMKERSCAVF